MIYRINTQNYYLKSIVDFVCEHYAQELDQLTIILPSGVVCYYLKELFKLNIAKSAFLPEITPIINLRYQFCSQANIASYEQKYVLANIIQSYNNLDINFISALKLADSLYDLISKFTYNDLDICNLENIIDFENEPEHWYTTQNFLKFASAKWQSYLNSKDKIDFAQNYLKIVNTLPDIIVKNPQRFFILAGFFGDNKILQTMFNKCSAIQNCHVILPSFNLENENSNIVDLTSDNPFFFIKNFLENSNIENSKILDLGQQNKENIIKNIQYFCAYNLREEVKFIFSKIQEILSEKHDAKILLVTENTKLISFLTKFLINRDISFNNHIAYNFLEKIAVSCFIEIAIIFSDELDLQKLINILKNPYFVQDGIDKLESKIIKDNKRHISIDEILEEYKKHYSCLEYLQEILSKKQQSKDIMSIALLHIELFKYFYADHQSQHELFDLLLDIVNFAKESIDIKNYEEILKIFLNSKNNIATISQNSKVIIAKANDAIMIDSDYVIIPEFNDDIWPKDLEEDTWLTPSVRNKLAFSTDKHRISLSFYIFYCLQSRKNIYLTRSLYSNKKSTITSRFVTIVNKYISDSQNSAKNIDPNANKDLAELNNHFIAVNLENSNYFPEKISASSTELLVRNPYGFYAARIVKLAKFKYLHNFDSNAEFGSFLHKVIELYTKNFIQDSYVNLRNKFLQISQTLLSRNYEPFQLWWQRRVNNFADSFLDFDLNRRINSIKIFSEHSGEIVLDLNNKKQKITAIADRIEICKNNKVHIFDYKTGTLPPNKDINHGLSPQLIVNALIAYYGGFSGIKSFLEINIYYIKLSSKEPFLRISPVKINLEELLAHEDALKNLLQFYTQDNAIFIAHPNKSNSPKYDDYKHLSRII